jgi:hypothetical protein
MRPDCGQTGTPVGKLGGQSPTCTAHYTCLHMSLSPCKSRCRYSARACGLEIHSFEHARSGRCTPRHARMRMLLRVFFACSAPRHASRSGRASVCAEGNCSTRKHRGPSAYREASRERLRDGSSVSTAHFRWQPWRRLVPFLREAAARRPSECCDTVRLVATCSRPPTRLHVPHVATRRDGRYLAHACVHHR